MSIIFHGVDLTNIAISEIAAVPPRSNDHLAKRENSAPFVFCAAFFLK